MFAYKKVKCKLHAKVSLASILIDQKLPVRPMVFPESAKWHPDYVGFDDYRIITKGNVQSIEHIDDGNKCGFGLSYYMPSFEYTVGQNVMARSDGSPFADMCGIHVFLKKESALAYTPPGCPPPPKALVDKATAADARRSAERAAKTIMASIVETPDPQDEQIRRLMPSASAMIAKQIADPTIASAMSERPAVAPAVEKAALVARAASQAIMSKVDEGKDIPLVLVSLDDEEKKKMHEEIKKTRKKLSRTLHKFMDDPVVDLKEASKLARAPDEQEAIDESPVPVPMTPEEQELMKIIITPPPKPPEPVKQKRAMID